MNDERKARLQSVIRQFLAENPQHISGTKTATIDGAEEILMDTETVIALAQWAKAKGFGSAERADALISALKNFRG